MVCIGAQTPCGNKGSIGRPRVFQEPHAQCPSVTATTWIIREPVYVVCSCIALHVHYFHPFRVLNLFLEEIFATKVMIPAMNYVATPVSHPPYSIW